MAKKKVSRAQRQRLNAPFVQGSPLTYGQVAHDRNTEVGLRYGPLERQLAQRQTNNQAWFDQYRAIVAGNATAQQQQYQQAVQGVRDQGAAQMAAAGAERARVDAGMRADAASRGASYSGVPGAQAAGGADVRQQLVDSFANALSAGGTAWGGYSAGQQNVGAAAQLSERLKTQKDLAGLQTDKGLYGAKYMADRRDAERRSVLENAAFGLKEQVAAQKALPTPAQKKTQAELDYFNQHGYFPSTGAPKPKTPKVTAPDVKVKSTIRRAVLAVKKHDNGSDTYWRDAFTTLVEKDGLDPAVAQAVVQGARFGRLGPKTAKTLLADYGIDAKMLGFTKPRVRPKPYTPSYQAGNSDPKFGGEG